MSALMSTSPLDRVGKVSRTIACLQIFPIHQRRLSPEDTAGLVSSKKLWTKKKKETHKQPFSSRAKSQGLLKHESTKLRKSVDPRLPLTLRWG